MAEEEFTIVTIEDNYYRDCFSRVLFIIGCLVASIAALVAISAYILFTEPPPVTFKVAEEWRIVPPVDIQEPYLSEGDLLQWVADVVPRLFDVDFLHIDDQLNQLKQYFTDNGYQVFLNQFNNNVDRDKLQSGKMFATDEITGAPIILNQGLLSGRYAWWVQIPINISYAGMETIPSSSIKLTLLVVRTETSNSLNGVAIDNVLVEKGNDATIVSNR